jgi:ssRNA-specific RNase YbeY (16S rRNA maturation enzyme)
MRTRTEVEIMNFWRKRNGITNVMSLPTELRLLVFEMATAPNDKIYPLSKSNR